MNKLINPCKLWWQSISQREQRLVVACSLLSVSWRPVLGRCSTCCLHERANNAQMRIQSEKQLACLG